MSDDARRQRRYRERNAAGGLVEVKVIVPADRVEELHAFAAALRAGKSPRAARRRSADDASQHDLFGPVRGGGEDSSGSP